MNICIVWAKCQNISQHNYIWHAQAASYQVQVFACLTEEEALHSILFGFVHDVVESGIPTSVNITAQL